MPETAGGRRSRSYDGEPRSVADLYNPKDGPFHATVYRSWLAPFRLLRPIPRKSLQVVAFLSPADP